MSKQKKYYIDPVSLQLREEKRPISYFLFWVSLVVFMSSIIASLGLYYFGHVFESEYAKSLKVENETLRSQIGNFVERISVFHHRIESLSKQDEDLRRLVDLPALDEAIRQAGVGGAEITTNLVTGDVEIDKLLTSTNEALDQINRQLAIQKQSYHSILEQFKSNETYFSNFPAIKPIRGRLTSGFGLRYHPIYKIRRMHEGVDFVAPRGTPVYASGGGKIKFAGGNPRTGFGRLVIIDHGNGLITKYAHLTNVKVRTGQAVKRGDVIAYSGNTGVSTAPHLHYEVHFNGLPQDPVMYFLDDLDPVEYNIAINQLDINRPSLD